MLLACCVSTNMDLNQVVGLISVSLIRLAPTLSSPRSRHKWWVSNADVKSWNAPQPKFCGLRRSHDMEIDCRIHHPSSVTWTRDSSLLREIQDRPLHCPLLSTVPYQTYRIFLVFCCLLIKGIDPRQSSHWSCFVLGESFCPPTRTITPHTKRLSFALARAKIWCESIFVPHFTVNFPTNRVRLELTVQWQNQCKCSRSLLNLIFKQYFLRHVRKTMGKDRPLVEVASLPYNTRACSLNRTTLPLIY